MLGLSELRPVRSALACGLCGREGEGLFSCAYWNQRFRFPRRETGFDTQLVSGSPCSEGSEDPGDQEKQNPLRNPNVPWFAVRSIKPESERQQLLSFLSWKYADLSFTLLQEFM